MNIIHRPKLTGSIFALELSGKFGKLRNSKGHRLCMVQNAVNTFVVQLYNSPDEKYRALRVVLQARARLETRELYEKSAVLFALGTLRVPILLSLIFITQFYEVSVRAVFPTYSGFPKK